MMWSVYYVTAYLYAIGEWNTPKGYWKLNMCTYLRTSAANGLHCRRKSRYYQYRNEFFYLGSSPGVLVSVPECISLLWCSWYRGLPTVPRYYIKHCIIPHPHIRATSKANSETKHGHAYVNALAIGSNFRTRVKDTNGTVRICLNYRSTVHVSTRAWTFRQMF